MRNILHKKEKNDIHDMRGGFVFKNDIYFTLKNVQSRILLFGIFFEGVCKQVF